MKLKKHRGRQQCDEATDDTDEIKPDSDVRDHGHADGQLVHKPDEDADHIHLDCQQVKFNLSEVGSFLLHKNRRSKQFLIQPFSSPQRLERGDDHPEDHQGLEGAGQRGDDHEHGHADGQLGHKPDED